MRSLRELTCLFAVVLVGCGDASPDLNGGDPLFTDACAKGGANSGSTWTDLYACYFGPTGKASCGGQDQCHVASTTTAARVYFVCGPDKDACWQGLMQGVAKIKADAGIDPTQGEFYQSLHVEGTTPEPLSNNMPYNSSFGFTSDDLARIAAWLQQGAPDN